MLPQQGLVQLLLPTSARSWRCAASPGVGDIGRLAADSSVRFTLSVEGIASLRLAPPLARKENAYGALFSSLRYAEPPFTL